ncbi:MAG: Mrp/NBP35 family ATP-binding protein [Planctomycetes bacterium]|nr:Mrp/NBP35 family ATP-binding protein [Planctomycetota bacterium]
MTISPPDLAAVNAVLADFSDPESGRSIVAMGQVRDLAISGGNLRMTLGLTTYAAPLWEETRAELVELLKARVPGLGEVRITLAEENRPPQKLGQVGVTAKSVVAVASGKGGVGKSTIAASIALGLARSGCKIGLMDADVYGPSIPHLLGLQGRPELVDKKLQPLEVSGVKVMSMGFLVPADEPIIWRGPMLHGAITNFLRDTAWGDLDYLIIDMPPGTGDIALTLSQLLPLSGAVIVCTPQDVALLDAVKALMMYRKVNIPILGVVENMSFFLCPDNNKRYDIFGSGGARRRAEQLSVPFLGEVPLQIPIRIHGDEGKTAANFDDPASAPYLEAICHRMVKKTGSPYRKTLSATLSRCI